MIKQRKNSCCHCLLLVLLSFISAVSFAQSKDSVEVMKAATKFINAFNRFQWQPFRESFTDDASIFFPVWDYVSRVNGRKGFEKTWLELFPEFENNPRQDSLTISPKNLLVQLYGHTAIMTFHLGDGKGELSRRTIVWVKQQSKWKIAHLHASVLVNND